MSPAYPETLDTSLAGLDWLAWLDRLRDLTDEDGYTEELGEDHAAIFVETSPVLLVCFENFDIIDAASPESQPAGWDVARQMGWSSLTLASKGQSWFRQAPVYGYFDRLVDDGFFEEFDQVLFYGAGPCGYAAAAFSVAAPGARVLLVQPQATLDPARAGWDTRFIKERRRDFATRYGYAPDMLDACDQAVLLFDPEVKEDAMHAALFARAGVQTRAMRFMGPKIGSALARMNLLMPLLNALEQGPPTDLILARLLRARREDAPYLKAVLAQLEKKERLKLVVLLARHALRHTPGPRFRRSLRAAYDRAESLGLEMPPLDQTG
ncbi:MAG: phosphoadenosine phosphosulfate reductase [Pseudomonadota bacterium]